MATISASPAVTSASKPTAAPASASTISTTAASSTFSKGHVIGAAQESEHRAGQGPVPLDARGRFRIGQHRPRLPTTTTSTAGFPGASTPCRPRPTPRSNTSTRLATPPAWPACTPTAGGIPAPATAIAGVRTASAPAGRRSTAASGSAMPPSALSFIGNQPWGWLPYHYGGWIMRSRAMAGCGLRVARRVYGDSRGRR